MPESEDYRRMVAMQFQSVDEKLDRILAQTTATNGRVSRNEIAIAVLQVGYVVGGVILAGVAAYLFGKLP